MKPQPEGKTGVRWSAWLGRLSDDVWWWLVHSDYADWRFAFRLLRIRFFFGFCEFAVTNRGGVYLLRWSLVAVHLFEHFKDFGCCHDRFCVRCGVWRPNDQSSGTRDKMT